MFLEKVYNGRNQWYYYIFTLLIVFFVWQVIGVIPLMIYTFNITPGLLEEMFCLSHPEVLQTALNTALQTNGGLALMILSFGFGMAALLWCIRYIHGKKIISVITARPRIDLKKIFFAAGVWSLLSLLGFLLQFISANPEELVFQFEPVNFFILLLISLTLLPIQTSFEELLFRGYLMQWSAYLFQYRWVAVALTGILFGIMHGANPETEMGLWIVMPQYILMGLLLSYITVKDDGMELALGLHMANNILAAITVTSGKSALQTHALFREVNPTASHWDTLGMLVFAFLFLWICNHKYHFYSQNNLGEKINQA